MQANTLEEVICDGEEGRVEWCGNGWMDGWMDARMNEGAKSRGWGIPFGVKEGPVLDRNISSSRFLPTVL